MPGPLFQCSSALLLLANIINARSTLHVDPNEKPFLPAKGLDIPEIGLGLWNSKDKHATHAVRAAFDAGYTHFDSAAAYSNEDYVGKGLEYTNLARDQYWITSKLWNTMHRPDLVPQALNKTLTQLNTPYLDLYLMHWPVAFLPDQGSRTVIDQDTTLLDTWRAMEDLVTLKVTRHIGVSNFSPRQLDLILSNCHICPFAHEFETHPYLQQTEFIKWHHSHDIKVIAYSPLANVNPTYDDKYPDLPSILEDKFWTELAEAKNVTVAQAVLAWGRQRGTIVIPKSVHEKRIVENFGSLKVEFSEEEMRKIAESDKRTRFNDPSESWGVMLFEGLDDGNNRFLQGVGGVEEL